MDRSRLTAIVPLIILLVGCAEVGPPPGGPEDKQGPTAVSSDPANQAVNQTGVRTVSLLFSERVTPPSQGTTVYISPRPDKPPQISWGANRLTIKFADTLASNQTYVISVSGTLTDLRGNKPDTAITLAFATGPTLDSGRISGRVYLGEKGAPGVHVALYDTAKLGATTPYDSVFSEYLTSTGAGGEFTFRNLPQKRFRLIAYEKTGRDDRFRPLRDRFAVPDREIVVGAEVSLDNLALTLTSQDTLPVRIVSAMVNQDRLVQVKLSRSLPAALLDSILPGFVVAVGGVPQPAIAFIPSDGLLSATVTAYAGPIGPGMASVSWQIEPGHPAARFDSLRVFETTDTSRPIITAFFPDDKPLLTIDTAVHIRFSEPLDTTALTDSAMVMRSAKDSLAVGFHRSLANPFEVVLRADSLVAGNTYMLKIRESDFRDRAGNRMGDSTRMFQFSILPPDSLGWIQGVTQVRPSADSAAPISLVFYRVGDGRRFSLNGPRGAFSIPLPGGKYVINGYVDRNGNRQFDAGAVFPYTWAETQVHYADTVSVRARFETAGVELEFK